jgi:hypothetical protein
LLLVPPEVSWKKTFFDVLPTVAAIAENREYRVFQLGAIFLELPLGKFWLSCYAPMEQSDDRITHFV